MRKDERYNKRGVSASKEDVHNAIKNIDKGVFPRAFCKIVPDYLGGDEAYCNITHTPIKLIIQVKHPLAEFRIESKGLLVNFIRAK